MVRESPVPSSQVTSQPLSPKRTPAEAVVTKSKKRIQFKQTVSQTSVNPKQTSRSPQSSQGRSKTKILNRKQSAIEKNLAEEIAT